MRRRLTLSLCDAGDSQTSRTYMGTDRALLLDRLASNVAKRKNSVPQKFTGKKVLHLNSSLTKRRALTQHLWRCSPVKYTSPVTIVVFVTIKCKTWDWEST